MNYTRIPTSAEVWTAIRNQHMDQLCVFRSFSNPDGTFYGGCGTRGEMFTAYGFSDSDCPLMEARTTWDIDRARPYERINETHEYWLCLPQEEDSD